MLVQVIKRRAPTCKGKSLSTLPEPARELGQGYTMEENIRTLREKDSGKAIIDICREKNLSEVTFHRWNR